MRLSPYCPAFDVGQSWGLPSLVHRARWTDFSLPRVARYSRRRITHGQSLWSEFAIGCAECTRFRLASDSVHLYIPLWMNRPPGTFPQQPCASGDPMHLPEIPYSPVPDA